MPLAAGDRIGPYEIVGVLGAGGMGQVFRARDTHLDRQVAIKVLPDAVASDPDRLARFEREAKMLAALDHPLIAHVYGFEQHGQTRAIVMELVEGPTLEELIATGHPEAESVSSRPADSKAQPARGGGPPSRQGRFGELGRSPAGGQAARGLRIDDCLRIARQIAEALETAHELGIVHRDLKPANIKLKLPGAVQPRGDDRRHPADVAECTVKVLDFGLAKAVDPGGHASTGSLDSPTMSARATELGTILGTAAYMAPEQARGRAVDRRADVWAFGVVLYEMLTGTRLFKGEDSSDTMAAVLRQPIVLDALPPLTPGAVRALIARCLERDPRLRLRDIGEARIALDRAIASPTAETAVVATVPAPEPSRVRTLVPWSLFAVAMVALALVLGPWARSAPPMTSAPVTRVVSKIGVPGSLAVDPAPAAVLSPDGRMIVLRVRQDNTTKLYVRRLDELDATAIAGSEQAVNPFFSPDGRSLGFFAGGGLKTTPLAGGAIATLTDAATGRGAAWAENGDILFQSSLFPETPLVRVTAAGVRTDRATTLATDEAAHRWPEILPNGHILYSSNADVANWDDGTLRVQTEAGVPGKVVLRGGYHGRYAPSGHLLYVHAGTLYAVRFDLDRLEATSAAAPIVEHIVATTATGGAQFSIASNGTLAYVPGNPTSVDGRMYWLTADGKTSVLTTPPGAWSNPRFSPDGRQIAMQITYGRHEQVAVYDWGSDRLTVLTADASNHRYPAWSPDGQQIFYSGDEGGGGTLNIFRVRADGLGRAERLTTSPQNQHVMSMHPSGRFVLYADSAGAERSGLWVLPVEGGQKSDGAAGTPRQLFNAPEYQALAAFSPDGRLVAYMGSEQGTFNIYVRRFDGEGSAWKVSTDGGAHPVWSKTATELLYVYNADDQIMTVPYRFDGRTLTPERPRPWTSVRHTTAGPTRKYDLHPDGRRAIVATPDTTGAMTYDSIVFVFNFFDELRRRLP